MSSLSVLVLSCDKYSGLWDLFFSRWAKYWPECPYPVFLLSNKKEYSKTGVKTLLTGEDKDWSSNLLQVIDQIDSDDVLLMIEDAPLDAEVDSTAFQALYRRYVSEGMNYLNLKADPRPRSSQDKVLGVLPPGALYRAALVPSIWKRTVLRELLRPGETAWAFEIHGSDRSDVYPGFHALRQPFLKLLHCVIRGRLDLRAVKALRTSGELGAVAFEPMSLGDYIGVRLREWRGTLFATLVPATMRRAIRSFYYRTFAGQGRIV